MATDIPVVALDTILCEGYEIRKGDLYPPTHPHVAAHSAYFAPADTPTKDLRQMQADLWFEATKDAYQPPPPPPPVKMRATRDFTYQVTEDKTITKGTVVLSDDDTFVLNARHFEPVDKPRGK